MMCHPCYDTTCTVGHLVLIFVGKLKVAVFISQTIIKITLRLVAPHYSLFATLLYSSHALDIDYKSANLGNKYSSAQGYLRGRTSLI